MSRNRVVVAGLGDSGVLTAIRLARHTEVVGISAKPALLSGKELGLRLTRPGDWAGDYWVPFDRFCRLDRVTYYPAHRLLLEHHPRVWSVVRRRLSYAGVACHPGYRAQIPAGFDCDRITSAPVSCGSSAGAASGTPVPLQRLRYPRG